jgi:ribosome-binding protein aMBF1 (putative translation factor)
METLDRPRFRRPPREPAWDLMRPYPLDAMAQLGMSTIGIIVRGGRLACGLSQRQLAALAGMNQSTISRLENGQLRHFKFQRLATVIGVINDPLLGRPARPNRWS